MNRWLSPRFWAAVMAASGVGQDVLGAEAEPGIEARGGTGGYFGQEEVGFTSNRCVTRPWVRW
ncbi:hypothetical protein [Streptomyces sp. SP18CS02]|uniref:hypothetical protein n=1 Tax=Streptomyces sp. SP18CS02 TaxID=3002531 RepID=UPI002E79FE56|nr:hypothetical protein [Streptomyces sp. SP18CS02]MEE1751245.1 hypothetical protein [Streptomyces sp. SP18CS02]